MTYQELLQEHQWLEKRKEILLRDCNECSNCHNAELVKQSEKGHLIELSFEKINTLAYFNSDDSRFDPALPQYRAKFMTDCSHEVTTTFYSPDWLKYDQSQDLKDYQIYYSLKSEPPNSQATDYTINAVISPPSISPKWLYAKDLHVHHTYYQLGSMPWEYPSKSLQTLCWVCHRKLHEQQTIPVYDAKSQIVNNLTTCNKCQGTGHLPEYNYYHDGICFGCWGTTYKELSI